MVLLSSEHGFAEALGFCEELRKVVPKQWVALLAGPPRDLQEMATL
jgi:hypothetical protein